MLSAEDRIWEQFYDPTAQQELRELPPAGFDWPGRTRETLELLVPRLRQTAANLVTSVPAKFNSPIELFDMVVQGRRLFAELASRAPAFLAWLDRLTGAAQMARNMVALLESQQVSAEIQRSIILPEALGTIVQPNGGSVYPDLLVSDRVYSGLPNQSRAKPLEGPCLRGSKPSNVPDGCEIKTNQGFRVKVDAHGAHPGLHFAVTWNFDKDGRVQVTGVWGAYVRIADHRESGRNVKVTTVKHSFGHELFTSLL